MNKKISIIAIVLIVLALAYWLLATEPAANTPSDTQDITSNEPANNVDITKKGALGVATSAAGNYLVDLNGLTLYVNEKDSKQTSTTLKASCDATCEKTWPPYIKKDTDVGMTQTTDPLLSKLNVVTRADGKFQYALGNQPLYYYTFDTKLGDMNGKNISTWFVAKP